MPENAYSSIYDLEISFYYFHYFTFMSLQQNFKINDFTIKIVSKTQDLSDVWANFLLPDFHKFGVFTARLHHFSRCV